MANSEIYSMYISISSSSFCFSNIDSQQARFFGTEPGQEQAKSRPIKLDFF